MKKLFTKKGFTLIELLLVLAIIGVLTSFLVANLIGAKARARDAQRKSDLQQIRAALELYRADLNSYPPAPLTCGSALLGNSATYMTKVPCDPLSKSSYSYTLTGGGTGYSLVA